MIYISISGAISVGKSLIFEYLKQKENLIIDGRKFHKSRILFIEEPVEKFKNFSDFNVLEKMTGFTLASQIAINLCMYDLYSNLKGQTDKYDVIISERNLYSGLIFSHTLNELGFLTEFEMTVLEAFHNRIISELFPKPDFVLLIKADPRICAARIMNRGREGEENISIQYITKLCHYYDSNDLTKVYKPSKIIKMVNESNNKKEIFQSVDDALQNLSS